eukprot:ctg_2021.g585
MGDRARDGMYGHTGDHRRASTAIRGAMCGRRPHRQHPGGYRFARDVVEECAGTARAPERAATATGTAHAGAGAQSELAIRCRLGATRRDTDDGGKGGSTRAETWSAPPFQSAEVYTPSGADAVCTSASTWVSAATGTAAGVYVCGPAYHSMR